MDRECGDAPCRGLGHLWGGIICHGCGQSDVSLTRPGPDVVSDTGIKRVFPPITRSSTARKSFLTPGRKPTLLVGSVLVVVARAGGALFTAHARKELRLNACQEGPARSMHITRVPGSTARSENVRTSCLVRKHRNLNQRCPKWGTSGLIVFDWLN